MKWIPTTENLPHLGDDKVSLIRCLVTCRGGVEQAFYHQGNDRKCWTFDGQFWWTTEELGIKAWMPIPEPYEEKNESKTNSE